ncbi:cell surface protein [Algibacter pacificus]|uniref:cell surface protein n=1 Tax=Algibacter pacificus TaxID=2599389 RepID=UPI0011C8FDB8|nr:cell surface protein [Algibacter pacificus]
MTKFITILKPRLLFIIPALVAMISVSCSSEDDVIAPEIQLSEASNNLVISMGETLNFSAENLNKFDYEETWTLADLVVSSTSTYEFIPETSGEYVLSYKAFNEAGEYTFDYTIVVDAKIRSTTVDSNMYVTTLLDYLPAPGQKINTSLGTLEAAQTLEGKKGMVTLGGWGGAVSYAFDHTVLNTEDSNDIIVYGNAMSGFAEPGVIWVMQDENANGIADDTWYEIKGAADELEGTIKNYSVTYTKPDADTDDVPWTDSEGNSGVIATNAYNTQAYYPESVTEDSYTITGTLLPDINIDMSNPTWIKSNSFDSGYADNTPGGDEIDIASAIDSEGNTVNLTGIDFIKIQTGIQANMGWLGELSTEVTGIADLNLL